MGLLNPVIVPGQKQSRQIELSVQRNTDGSQRVRGERDDDIESRGPCSLKQGFE